MTGGKIAKEKKQNLIWHHQSFFVVSSLSLLLTSDHRTQYYNMKILVGVKRVVDYAVKVRVQNNAVDLSNVKVSFGIKEAKRRFVCLRDDFFPVLCSILTYTLFPLFLPR
jgi:hypothetical protein